MNKKSEKIKSLMEGVLKELIRLGYSEQVRDDHQRRWERGIFSFMEKYGYSDYSPDLGQAYLNANTRSKAPSSKRAMRRSIAMLDEFLETGTVRKRIVRLVEFPLDGEIGEWSERYLESMKSMRRSEFTILNHRRMLFYFIQGLKSKGKCRIEELTEKDIIDFIDAAEVAKGHHFYTIKSFCKFLYTNGAVKSNLGYVLEHNRPQEKEKLPSVYSKEEIIQIEKSIEQSSAVGKRDYAIFLMASRLGLRASDIAAFSFDNIDWDKNLITLRQYKTKNPVELPLLVDLGEALVTYIRDARPKSNCRNVFLTAKSPYSPMTRISINGVISRIMCQSGVDTTGRHFGPHSLRHSLASNLLKDGTSIETISSALGHESTQTTMGYLRIDIQSLRMCPMEVPLVDESFYNQGGGVFYV